ncbi:hypothetical protein [Roseivivax lentus]|uniref:hypothetical protein n=1 Tax=Roseivivax lentus TaxID=633194 RepID=UPI00097081EA|nr:hypothetical protein [Roseivivax lentus]
MLFAAEVCLERVIERVRHQADLFDIRCGGIELSEMACFRPFRIMDVLEVEQGLQFTQLARHASCHPQVRARVVYETLHAAKPGASAEKERGDLEALAVFGKEAFQPCWLSLKIEHVRSPFLCSRRDCPGYKAAVTSSRCGGFG